MNPPDGIVITISAAMIKERGYRNWLRNFLDAMSKDEWTYWMRLGAIPKREVLYVYLCIGGFVRFRANFVMYDGPGEKEFSTGHIVKARAWVVMAGPLTKGRIPMKGFRGFRYVEKLF